MWECENCGTTGIINQDFCPTCFTPRPETEVGEMAESDVAASEGDAAAERPADADTAGDGPETGREPAAPDAAGYSEANPSGGGFLTDWGR